MRFASVPALDAVRSRVLVPLGRRLRAPRVQITSPLVRGGNFLYDWMWAYLNDSRERPARVLYQPEMDAWIQEFPLVGPLTVRKDELWRLFTDFNGDSHPDVIGRDFTAEDTKRFTRALIESSPSFSARLAVAAEYLRDDSCTINVRRGDYYQYEHLQASYGMDIKGYVGDALKLVASSGRAVNDYVIVSDDIPWSMQHIPALLSAPGRAIEYRTSMFDDLAILATSRTLIIANSTFSFWGAHMAGAISDDLFVVAPPYHFIDKDGSPSRERFDPMWRVVERPL